VHYWINCSTYTTFLSFKVVVFTQRCVGGGLIDYGSVGVSFCSCKSCYNLSQVGFFDFFCA
jgi:hypothetical protein